MFIDSSEAFEAFIEHAATAPMLAIDTEFLRERTYYPKLCLLQLATPERIALVDPLAITDLSPLRPLLLDEGITKVFHAATQDLEILLREVGVLPTPVFDTQIAASLLGFSQQTGYGALVASVCGVTLKKADSFTDWSRRPLSDSQFEYAADDVRYLPQVYETLSSELKRKGRLAWLADDFANLSDPAQFDDDPYLRYRRLKRVSHLSRKQLSAAREVTAWREKEARKRNIPRKWVLTDEQIVELCKKEARTIDELFLIRGIKDHLSTRDARQVAEAMKRGLDAKEEDYPQLSSSSHNEANVDAAVDLMLALARQRAKESGVALQTLASHDDLVKLARGYHESCALMHGWRKVLVGNELQELLEGRLSLRLREGKLVADAYEARKG